jgi:hypothetical protein
MIVLSSLKENIICELSCNIEEFIGNLYMGGLSQIGRSLYFKAIDLESNYTRMVEREFKELRPILKEMQNFNNENGIVFSQYSDNVTFNEGFYVDNLWFVYDNNNSILRNNIEYIDNVFAFAKVIQNRNYSIVHRLKDMGLIINEEFIIEINSTSSEKPKGKIYFGELPYHIQTSYLYFYTFNSFHNQTIYWKCMITHVLFNNELVSLNNEARFSSTLFSIYFPKSISLENMLMEYNLKQYIHVDDTNKMICDCQYISLFPNITLVINSIKYVIYDYDYIHYKDQKCIISLQQNMNDNDWIIGYLFFYNKATSFNYNSNMILIYSNIFYSKFNVFTYKIQKLCLFCILLCLLNILYISIVIIKKIDYNLIS